MASPQAATTRAFTSSSSPVREQPAAPLCPPPPNLAQTTDASAGFVARMETFQTPPSRSRSVKPVSYTHLDVYKRQVRGMANAEKTMLKALEKDLQTRFAGKKVHIAAAYSGDIKPALEWRKTTRKYFDDNSIELYKLPISICCHVSSGVKALGCFEYFE